MPLAYSTDLRLRAVWMHMAHKVAPTRIVDVLVCLSVLLGATWSFFYQVGDVKPQPRKNGPDRLLGEFEQVVLLMLVLETLGVCLHELRTKLLKHFGSL